MKNETSISEFTIHTAVWLALLVLIGVSSAFIETRGAVWLAVFVGAAAIKFLAIALQFMEARRAHGFWIFWLCLLCGAYVVGATIFLRS